MVEALTTQLRSMKNGVNKEVAYVNKAGQIEGTVNYADPKSKFYALSSTGKTINNFEDVIIPTAKDEIHHVETHRKQAEGNRIAGKQKWYHDKQGNKEAGYRIITGAKTSTGGPKIKNDNVDHKPTAPKAETPKAPSAPTGGSPAGH